MEKHLSYNFHLWKNVYHRDFIQSSVRMALYGIVWQEVSHIWELYDKNFRSSRVNIIQAYSTWCAQSCIFLNHKLNLKTPIQILPTIRAQMELYGIVWQEVSHIWELYDKNFRSSRVNIIQSYSTWCAQSCIFLNHKLNLKTPIQILPTIRAQNRNFRRFTQLDWAGLRYHWRKKYPHNYRKRIFSIFLVF